MRIYGRKCAFVLNFYTFCVLFFPSLSKELQTCLAQQACMAVNLCFLFFSKGLFDESGKTRDTRNIIIKNSVRVHEVRMISFTVLFYYNLYFIFSKFHFQFENSSTTLPRLSFKSSTANPETFKTKIDEKTKIIDQTKNTTSDIRLSKSDHSMVTSDMFHGLQGEVKTVRNQLSYGIYIHSMIRTFSLICRVEPIQRTLIQQCYYSCPSNMFSILIIFSCSRCYMLLV